MNSDSANGASQMTDEGLSQELERALDEVDRQHMGEEKWKLFLFAREIMGDDLQIPRDYLFQTAGRYTREEMDEIFITPPPRELTEIYRGMRLGDAGEGPNRFIVYPDIGKLDGVPHVYWILKRARSIPIPEHKAALGFVTSKTDGKTLFFSMTSK